MASWGLRSCQAATSSPSSSDLIVAVGSTSSSISMSKCSRRVLATAAAKRRALLRQRHHIWHGRAKRARFNAHMQTSLVGRPAPSSAFSRSHPSSYDHAHHRFITVIATG